MAWKRLRDANMATGYQGGWCLKFVQDAFGTDHPYPSATSAWNANYGNGNHPGELPPAGQTVPVYLSLGNVPEGHVAISLDDAGIASSSLPGFHNAPYFYKNLNALIADYAAYNGGATYLGWSEFVGTVHVVEWDNPNATADQVRQDYLDILERGADADGLQHYMNYTNDFVRADLLKSDEYKNLQASKIVKPVPPVITPPIVVEPVVEPPVIVPEPIPEPEPPIVVPPVVKPPVQPPVKLQSNWFNQFISSIIDFIKGIFARKK